MRTAAALLVLALGASGCAQPGPLLSEHQAVKLTVATGDISTACGFALQATAFPHQHPKLARLESLAHQGAVHLAQVFGHDDDQRDLYRGQSIGAIVNSSLALLSQCGLHQALAPLRATRHAQ